jgi:hypothetical protein
MPFSTGKATVRYPGRGWVKSLVVAPGNRFQGGKSEISGAIPRSAPVDEPFLIERKEA